MATTATTAAERHVSAMLRQFHNYASAGIPRTYAARDAARRYVARIATNDSALYGFVREIRHNDRNGYDAAVRAVSAAERIAGVVVRRGDGIALRNRTIAVAEHYANARLRRYVAYREGTPGDTARPPAVATGGSRDA